MRRWLTTLTFGLALHAAAHANPDAIAPHYLELLRDIVNINTDTQNVTGLAKAREVLIPHFEELGMKTSRHRLAEPGREVLSFELPGAEPRVLLVGHLDTVFGESSAFQTFELQSDRVVGPGVIDMKGGIVLMLNVLAQLKQSGQLGAVRVVLNDDEEIGSPHSKQTLRALGRGIPYGLVFEPGLDDGAVVSSQAGVRWIKLTSQGKAAHAGLEPENGIDACLDVVRKVQKLTDLSRPEVGLTINPGVIEGGRKPNVVCDRASVTVDVRFRSPADWRDLASAIERIRAHSDVFNQRLGQGAASQVTQLAEMPPLPASSTQTLVESWKVVTAQLGRSFKARGVGYGSDGNHLADLGMQLLVGLGPYGGGMHSDKEFMWLSSYRERLTLVTALVQKLTFSGAP